MKDVLEIRDGKDSWTDVTSDAGDQFVLDNESGTLHVYRRLFERIWWGDRDNRYLRASYRYGGLGGDPSRGGETTLSSSVSQGDTTFDVTEASRLPSTGVLLIENSEYVRIDSVDYTNDQVKLGSAPANRGLRGTSDEAHPDGAVVHYAPEYVRDAVASKVAIELLSYEDWVAQLTSSEAAPSPSQKIDDWQTDWEEALGNETQVRKL